jgi:hypothetical protein
VRCNGEKKEAEEEEEEEEEEGKEEEKQSVRSAVAIKTREKRRKLLLLDDITLPLPPPLPPMAFFLHIFVGHQTHTPNRSTDQSPTDQNQLFGINPSSTHSEIFGRNFFKEAMNNDISQPH